MLELKLIHVSKRDPRTPFYWHGFTLIPAWISNHMPGKVCGEITNPFLNFNGCTVEVWEWISNFITHFTGHVITYACMYFPSCCMHLPCGRHDDVMTWENVLRITRHLLRESKVNPLTNGQFCWAFMLFVAIGVVRLNKLLDKLWGYELFDLPKTKSGTTEAPKGRRVVWKIEICYLLRMT